MLKYDKQNLVQNKQLLDSNGYFKDTLVLCDSIRRATMDSDYESIDKIFFELTNKEGKLFEYLKQYKDFNSIEFIISLREAKNPWEEDGIWHDDGSRLMAFSLSLTLFPNKTQGGVLEIRKKGEPESKKIPIFDFGEIIVFKTGVENYEHKINKVSFGSRLIIAGWCS